MSKVDWFCYNKTIINTLAKQYINITNIFIPLYQKTICDNIPMLQILYSVAPKMKTIEKGCQL